MSLTTNRSATKAHIDFRADDGLTVAEVAIWLHTAISTLYRHLPSGRAALEPAAA